ncbi:hypothetical protein Bbelb_328580 [Branchiostoma belcheri]|nr:hypothetical protein Bbelb_328580 [Branchiostoma belcheri]
MLAQRGACAYNGRKRASDTSVNDTYGHVGSREHGNHGYSTCQRRTHTQYATTTAPQESVAMGQNGGGEGGALGAHQRWAEGLKGFLNTAQPSCGIATAETRVHSGVGGMEQDTGHFATMLPTTYSWDTMLQKQGGELATGECSGTSGGGRNITGYLPSLLQSPGKLVCNFYRSGYK